ncbi:MAG: hypothetical protein CMJ18_03265 [Phycisphaeraceae bacterium]|nr:hypothetical protein [Phycisphaeraceae bacterium]
MATGSSGASGAKGSNNVYTVLIAIAFLALLIGIGYIWIKSNSFFGTSNPFEVEPNPLSSAIVETGPARA